MRLDEQGLVVSIELAETALARELKFATDAERDRVIAARGDLDPALIARELGQVAAYGFETGVHPPAAEYAVALARRLRDRRTEAECLRLLATANHNRGMGLAAAEESLLVSIEAGSSDDIAASIFKIGIARWTAGDLRGAVDLLLTSARLIDTADDPRICLKSLYMASYVSQIGHDFRGGLVAAERVEQLSRKYGWTEGEAGGASLLGTMHRGLRNYDIAIAHYQRAAKIAEAIHNPIHRASAMASIAECELKRGNVAAAKAAADRAGAEAVTALTRFAIDMHVAAILAEEGRLEEADETLHCLSALARASGGWAKTTGAASIARSEIARRRGDPWTALERATEAWNVTITDDTLGMYWSPWPAYAAAGAALRALGEPELALAAYQSAVALIEESREHVPFGSTGRTHYLEDKSQPYVALVELLVEAGRNEEALLAAERIKARALREMLAEGDDRPRPPMTEVQQKEERQLEQEVLRWNLAAAAARLHGPVPDDVRTKLADARARLDEFTERMHIAGPDRRARTRNDVAGQVEPPPPGVAAIEYAVGDERTTAFVVRRGPDGKAIVEARTLPIRRERLRAQVAELAKAVERRDLAYAAAARGLYDAVFAPIEAALGDARTLCIVPDDELWKVPFQALRTRSGKWLVERYAVQYAPSLSTLREAPAREPRPRRVITFGNPSLQRNTVERVRAIYRDAPLGDLPEAEVEARTIARIYGPAATAFTGSGALESRLKEQAAGATVIHIATHGFLDQDAPMYSALSLAASRADGEDGLLEAREILALPLDADLAILSACETARGHVGAGEGVIGLPWAFLAAGCRATVVSQWKAESAAAAKLMIAFHQRYRAGRNPADALRDAQLALARHPRYRHPFYWAAFIVLGANAREP
ncbi:MAG TPA: CHAT domain-containing protein [Thermoanaerobaculia bacterium]|nr:CHAT domain-containing protein [Thermoanaerobaculia bacterium]